MKETTLQQATSLPDLELSNINRLRRLSAIEKVRPGRRWPRRIPLTKRIGRAWKAFWHPFND